MQVLSSLLHDLLDRRAINDRFIINSFLRKQTLLIKDEKQYEAWNHDQYCEHDHDEHSAKRAGRGGRRRERPAL